MRVRAWMVVIGAIVAVNLALYVVQRLTPAPSGPRSSSYATKPEGLAAWATLLQRNGTAVRRLRGELTSRSLGDARTVIALDAPRLLPREVGVLKDTLARGGTVIAGGAPPPGWVTRLAGGRRLGWRAGGATRQAGRGVPGVAVVRAAGEGTWTRLGSLRPIVGAPEKALALRSADGRLILLADPSPLQNRLLGRADNAQLGLSLAGRGPVAFAEGAHGYGRSTGLAAIPGRWKLALGLLVLAAIVLVLSRGRRLGPPQDPERALPPPRIDYVTSLAVVLRRTRDRDGASAPVAGAARARRAHAPPLDAEEAAAVEGAANDDDAVLARGRALAKLSRGGP